MTLPSRRILSPAAALAAARAVQTPAEVESFEAEAAASPSVRAFLETDEWRAIRDRIVGDGEIPLGPSTSIADVIRKMRWAADGVFDDDFLPERARAAYLHAASELESLERRLAQQAKAPADELAARRAAA